jgi:glycosyltransferase involved in cell wall biosynthesis
VGPSWQKLLLDVLMIFWTIGMLLRRRYTVVFAHEESVFWCRYLKPLFRFRLVYEMHSNLSQQLTNFQFTKSRVLIRIFKFLQDSSLKTADAVVTVCPALRDYVAARDVPMERHLMIENSIYDDVRLHDPAQPAEPESDGRTVNYWPGQPVILYAGTFEVYQGVELLVRAFAHVARARPDARLLLIGGTAKQVAEIRALADSLGLGDSCGVSETVSKAIAIRHSRAAQVLVSPRLHGNNTPLKIYEQIASGRPLVATRIWSHTQVLNESVCFLVDPDPESLASGLLEALNDEDRATQLAANALALYEIEYARPVYEHKVRRLLDLVR